MNRIVVRDCLGSLLVLTALAGIAPRIAGVSPASDAARSAIQERADRFLDLMNAGYQALRTVERRASWKARTDVTPAHDAAAAAAGEAQAAFCGNPAVIREARALLERRSELDPITARQLVYVLLEAAKGPMTNPDLVRARIEAETRQASVMNGFTFMVGGRAVTANEIDERLETLTDPGERRAVWEASKATGPALKPGLVELQRLRNGVARELGYPDFFALQMASHDMTTDEMARMNEGFLAELKPLYEQLYTWAKHELAARYGQPVPDRIPADWFPNRWAQDWSPIAASASLNASFGRHDAEWIVRQAEAFWAGLGMGPLPESFWMKSDLYPVAAADSRKKNSHASCWNVDLERDIRSLMSVEANASWFETAHHELGHAYYDLHYNRPEIPPLLRRGASSAVHEAMATIGGNASRQTLYLQSLGLLPAEAGGEEVHALLRAALADIPFMFWASGTMTHWEADLYANELPPGQWNARWWEYVSRFQGVVPPGPRGEEFCDPATKTHINDTPAYYSSYAVATVLTYQLDGYIAREILKSDPRRCTYAGNHEVGAFLSGMMRRGGTSGWRTLLRDATGEELSSRAMVEYFEPLMTWLERENRGRAIGWE
jgi:peptidyl-dipeptidase A